MLIKPFEMYIKDIRYHSFVVGIPMLISSVIQLSDNKNFMDDPEYKKVVNGVMGFNIVMFFISVFLDKRLSDPLALAYILFGLLVVCSFVVIGLVNEEKLSSDKVNTINVIMMVQSFFIILSAARR